MRKVLFVWTGRHWADKSHWIIHTVWIHVHISLRIMQKVLFVWTRRHLADKWHWEVCACTCCYTSSQNAIYSLPVHSRMPCLVLERNEPRNCNELLRFQSGIGKERPRNCNELLRFQSLSSEDSLFIQQECRLLNGISTFSVGVVPLEPLYHINGHFTPSSTISPMLATSHTIPAEQRFVLQKYQPALGFCRPICDLSIVFLIFFVNVYLWLPETTSTPTPTRIEEPLASRRRIQHFVEKSHLSNALLTDIVQIVTYTSSKVYVHGNRPSSTSICFTHPKKTAPQTSWALSTIFYLGHCWKGLKD